MTLSVDKIGEFFSKNPVKMQVMIQGASDEITTTDIEQMEIDDANEQQEDMEDLSLKDLSLVMLTI